MPELPSAFSGALFHVAFTILVVGSTMHPAPLVLVAILATMVLGVTIGSPSRWLLPWLLLGASIVASVYGLRERRPEDWEGDFILIVGFAPYFFGLMARLIVQGRSRG